MMFFRVSHNINVKATDGTLISYFKFKEPSNLENETIYATTFDDFSDLKEIFQRVDKEKYFTNLFKESNIRALVNFPIQLGIPNIDEYITRANSNQLPWQEIEKIDIFKQLKNIQKDEISIALIGKTGSSISEMITSCTALRILYKKLKEIYKNIKFDIYINASNNSFYTRDKELYQTQEFISNVFPLSISVKKLCEYDYFIDNSISPKLLNLDSLNCVDAWLLKFGINYEKIDDNEKYNQINISKYEVQASLINKLKEARLKGKLLLYHPYSANINKSIPQAIASEYLKELILKAEDYIIVSALAIDGKIKDDRFLDLTKESKNLSDFIYIISSMDKIITTDTATFHISDAFMIPTIVFFTNSDYIKDIKYFKYTKPIFIKDKSKNLSKFIYENENLTLYKFESWNKLKVSKIIKLLDTF